MAGGKCIPSWRWFRLLLGLSSPRWPADSCQQWTPGCAKQISVSQRTRFPAQLTRQNRKEMRAATPDKPLLVKGVWQIERRANSSDGAEMPRDVFSTLACDPSWELWRGLRSTTLSKLPKKLATIPFLTTFPDCRRSTKQDAASPFENQTRLAYPMVFNLPTAIPSFGRAKICQGFTEHPVEDAMCHRRAKWHGSSEISVFEKRECQQQRHGTV